MQLAYVLLLCALLLYMLFGIRLMTQYSLALSWVITAVFLLLTLVDIILVAQVQGLKMSVIFETLECFTAEMGAMD